MDETIRVQLNFPLQEVTKPIVWRLAHDFGLKFSIRRASIDIRTGGFTVLELTGPGLITCAAHVDGSVPKVALTWSCELLI